MKTQRLAAACTAVNLVLLALILAKVLPPTARVVAPGSVQATTSAGQAVVPTLRGRALELLDDRDQVRSRISVEPEGDVVLRLMDQEGTIRVKLGAGTDGSGLLLLDEATEPGVHLIARRVASADRPTTTSVTVRGADGRERVIQP